LKNTLFEDIKTFVRQNGYNLNDDSIKELSDHLDESIKSSAKELAEILRKKFGEPNSATGEIPQ